VRVAAAAARADGHRRHAEAQRHVRVGRGGAELRGAAGEARGRRGGGDERVVGGERAGGPVADHPHHGRDRPRARGADLVLRGGGRLDRAPDGPLVGVERVGRGGAQVDLEPRVGGDGVDAHPAADAPHRHGHARAGAGLPARQRQVGEARGGAGGGVHRVRRPERRPAVPARPAELGAEAPRPHGPVHHALVARAVEHHGRGGRPPGPRRLGEVVLGAAQVAEPLLAHRGHELDRAARAHAPPVERRRQRHQRGEPAPVVADPGRGEPHRAVGRAAAPHEQGRGPREHGVEVRAHRHRRLGRVAGPRAPRDHVAGGVEPHVREAERGEALRDPPGALALLARGRRDLGDGGLQVEQLGVARGEARARRGEGVVGVGGGGEHDGKMAPGASDRAGGAVGGAAYVTDARRTNARPGAHTPHPPHARRPGPAGPDTPRAARPHRVGARAGQPADRPVERDDLPAAAGLPHGDPRRRRGHARRDRGGGRDHGGVAQAGQRLVVGPRAAPQAARRGGIRPRVGGAAARRAGGTAGQVLAVRLVDRVGKGIRSSPRDALLAAAVPAAQRGRAFGFHRAADHLGAVLGPLVAFALLRGAGVDVRTVFALAAVPAALAMAALVFGVREAPGRRRRRGPRRRGRRAPAR
jgi:hypothetical protein